MDVEEICRISHERRKWADDAALQEAIREAQAAKQAAAIKRAKRRREAMAQAHWVSGALSGSLAVMTAWCIARGITLLAVSLALGTVAFGLAGCMIYSWLEDGR